MDIDFNPPQGNPSPPGGHQRRPLLILLLAVVVLAGAVLILRAVEPQLEARTAPPEISAPPVQPQVHREVVEGTIKPGDTVTGLLGSYFNAQQLHDLATTSRKVFPLSGICAGQAFKICLENGSVERFEYDIDRDDQLIVRPTTDGFDVSRVPIAYTVRTDLVHGTITTSLFDAVSGIGENPELAIALADIFAWDIDFIRDIREGDSFEALVEKRFRDGQPAGYGRILAAQFINQGDRYDAFLFQDGNRQPGYFDAAGNSVRKAFLRAPLAFSRISSGYSMHRFHPITKTWKAHPAIDYAAPVGTPIMAIGDGTISVIGRGKYNGNFIKLRHSNGLESIYLHMSRFAKGMSRGKRVAQGQVIGYVGATGLATGPHLCFRMRKNGEPINPTKLKSASAAPVSSAHLAEFKTLAASLQEALEGRRNLAQAQPPAPADGSLR